MIRFCDKEVYNITEGEMTRSQMFIFFLQNEEQRHSVIAVYDNKEEFLGIVTYYDLLEQGEVYKCLKGGGKSIRIILERSKKVF